MRRCSIPRTARASLPVPTISGLRTALDKEKSLSSEALSKVELLNQQIAALRRQIAAISGLLSDAEQRNKDSNAQIADLGKRLNSALAQRVQELSRYRSEFFGRLRQILSPAFGYSGCRRPLRVPVRSAVRQGLGRLNDLAKVEMDKLAEALLQLEKEIPGDIAWVLRVDGHTDADPITSVQFKSNWDLSAARSIAVVNYPDHAGVQPVHLVAAGFGEFQPLDPADTEDAKSRNRRIELKLTER